jgi:hypothetical protein
LIILKNQFRIKMGISAAELEDEICRGNAPVLTPESGGATTEGLPLQTNHTFIQQCLKMFNFYPELLILRFGLVIKLSSG